jgi:hypothetical protein
MTICCQPKAPRPCCRSKRIRFNAPHALQFDDNMDPQSPVPMLSSLHVNVNMRQNGQATAPSSLQSATNAGSKNANRTEAFAGTRFLVLYGNL